MASKSKKEQKEDFVEFLNKKKTKIGTEKSQPSKITKEVENPDNNGSLKFLLSKLEGKVFGEENSKSKVKKPQPEKQKIPVSKVELKESTETDGNLEEVKHNLKQFYKQKLEKGDIDEIPLKMKEVLKVKQEKKDKFTPKLETEEIHTETVVYQVKRFATTETKDDLRNFFIGVIGEDNFIKIKLMKNENKEFTGIVLLEVMNNEDSNSKLTSSRVIYKTKKLKISRHQI